MAKQKPEKKIEKALETTFKSAILVIFGLGVSKLIGLVFRVIVARIGVFDYGLYTFSYSIFDTVVALAVLGLPVGMIRFVSLYKNRNKEIEAVLNTGGRILFATSFLGAVLLYLLSGTIAQIAGEPRIEQFLQAFALAVPVWTLLQLPISIFYGFKQVKPAVLSLNIAEPLLRTVLTGVLVLAGLGIWAALWGQIATFYLVFILALVLARKIYRGPLFSLKKAFERRFIKYSMPVALSVIFSTPTRALDTILLGFLAGAFKVGIYEAAVPLAALLGVFPEALLRLFLPIFTELKNRDKTAFYQKITNFIFWINLPLLVALLFFGKPALGLLFGESYISSYVPLVLLGMSGFIYTWTVVPGRKVLDSFGRTDLNLWLTVAMVLSELLLGFWLIPSLDVVGAGLMVLLAVTLNSLLCSIFVKRESGILLYRVGVPEVNLQLLRKVLKP